MKQLSLRDQVYAKLREVPMGKVVTYGQLAALVGHPKAARAIGTFMRTNPDAPATPCHRVVGSDGRLTGYSAGAGLFTKLQMLKDEGVHFKGDRVNLSASQWHKYLG